jgi:hypothetical protein
MRELMTLGRVDETGILKVSHRDKFDTGIKTMAGKRVMVTVKTLYNKRSLLQNGYYWGVLVLIARQAMNEEWGTPDGEPLSIDSDQVHEILKTECNSREIVNKKTGEVSKVGQSTKALTTIEFEMYQERCRVWIQEYLDAYVPLPNEQLEMFELTK